VKLFWAGVGFSLGLFARKQIRLVGQGFSPDNIPANKRA
jgi:hypothetical protein